MSEPGIVDLDSKAIMAGLDGRTTVRGFKLSLATVDGEPGTSVEGFGTSMAGLAVAPATWASER